MTQQNAWEKEVSQVLGIFSVLNRYRIAREEATESLYRLLSVASGPLLVRKLCHWPMMGEV